MMDQAVAYRGTTVARTHRWARSATEPGQCLARRRLPMADQHLRRPELCNKHLRCVCLLRWQPEPPLAAATLDCRRAASAGVGQRCRPFGELGMRRADARGASSCGRTAASSGTLSNRTRLRQAGLDYGNRTSASRAGLPRCDPVGEGNRRTHGTDTTQRPASRIRHEGHFGRICEFGRSRSGQRQTNPEGRVQAR